MAPWPPAIASRYDMSGSASRLQARVTLGTNQAVLMTHLVVWLLTFLSGLFFALRMFAKAHRRAGVAVDDALLAAAWAAVFFYSVIASLELALGLGRPDDSSSSPSAVNAEPLILLDHVARTFCLTAVAWSKSAVAVALVRRRTSSPFKSVLHGILFGLIVLVNTVLASAIIAHWFRCMPITKEWDVSVEGSCWSMPVHTAIGIAAQSFSGAMNIALVVIGLMLVWGSSLKAADQVGILSLAFLGILAGAASITTAVEMSTITDDNFTQANLRILLAASIDTPLLLLGASLPALRLFRHAHAPKASISSLARQYGKHKNASSSNSTTIRLIPGTFTSTNELYSEAPTTAQSSVFPVPIPQTPLPATPLRGKASFSSSHSGGGGSGSSLGIGGGGDRAPPARPPRPASGEVGAGGFWADPSAPSALNGSGGAPTKNSAVATAITTNARGQTRHYEADSSRGLLAHSPVEAASNLPSPYTPGWAGGAPSASPGLSPPPPSRQPQPPSGGISPYNNTYPASTPSPHNSNDSVIDIDNDTRHDNNNNSHHELHVPDAFDTYDATFPTSLLPPGPRMLTPLPEEDQEAPSNRASYAQYMNSPRASSYRSSAVSSSTMTNSHWLDIPVPRPFHQDSDVHDAGARQSASNFSVNGFIDSYGPRAASVMRKMDLIVPMAGQGHDQQPPASSLSSSYLPPPPPRGKKTPHALAGAAEPSVVLPQYGDGITKPGNRDSPTLGDYYWGSQPPSPVAPGVQVYHATNTQKSDRSPSPMSYNYNNNSNRF